MTIEQMRLLKEGDTVYRNTSNKSFGYLIKEVLDTHIKVFLNDSKSVWADLKPTQISLQPLYNLTTIKVLQKS